MRNSMLSRRGNRSRGFLGSCSVYCGG